VDFFGIPACTASGLARIALRTDAAVVPDSPCGMRARKFILRFDAALELVRTGDDQADVIANTAKFTKIIEDYIRRYRTSGSGFTALGKPALKASRRCIDGFKN